MAKRDVKNQKVTIEKTAKKRHSSITFDETMLDKIVDLNDGSRLGFMTSNMYGEGKRPKPTNSKTSVTEPCDYPRSGTCPDSPPPMKHDFVVNPKYKEKKRRKDGEDD